MDFKNTFIGVLAFGLVVAVIVMAAVRPDFSFSIEPAKDVLTVSGEGTVTTMPDKAEIFVNILSMGATAEEAKELNSEISSTVTSMLKSAGLKKDSIETYNYQLYPKKKYVEEEETYIITGYELQHTLKLTTEEIDNAGNYVDTAVSAGANGVDRVKFDLQTETREAIEQEALARATEVAVERAVAMADAAEVELLKLVSVDGSAVHQPFYAARAETLGKGTEIMPQSLEVSASVKLVYEIE